MFDPAREKRHSKSVENSPAGVKTLLDWATQHGVTTPADLHAVLEATGVYHDRAALALAGW